MPAEISTTSWGFYKGEELFLFKLMNKNGAYAEITNYGAAIVAVVVPDKLQRFENVVIGFPGPDGYVNDTCYIGSTIGRYANRISNARFALGAKTYYLENNDGAHTNHGGYSGFNYRVFKSSVQNNELTMTLHSEDGEGGYPGNFYLTVTYTWNDNNELLINYDGASDKTTIANITNHSYFNLSAFKNKIGGHWLTINSARVLELRDDYTPTGIIIPAGENTFLNNIINDKFKVRNGRTTGLNLYYILDRHNGELNYAATLTDETSGRTLEVHTTYPGIFLYTGDHLSSTYLNHNGQLCEPFDGLCLECQHYPDSINHHKFPQATLQECLRYNQSILFKFGIK
jgi:aldose 1-epimerase